MAYSDNKPAIARALLANNLNQNKVKALGYNWGEVWKTAKAMKKGYKPPPEGGTSDATQTVDPNNPARPPQVKTAVKEEVKGLGVALDEKAKQKAAVQFTIGTLRVDLDLRPLYDAYLYWQDMVVKNGLQDGNFCEGVKDCVKTCWEILNHKRAEQEGIGVEPMIQAEQEDTDVGVGRAT